MSQLSSGNVLMQSPFVQNAGESARSLAHLASQALPMAFVGKTLLSYLPQIGLTSGYVHSFLKQLIVAQTAQKITSDPETVKEATKPFIAFAFYCQLPENIDFKNTTLFVLTTLTALWQMQKNGKSWPIGMAVAVFTGIAIGYSVANSPIVTLAKLSSLMIK